MDAFFFFITWLGSGYLLLPLAACLSLLLIRAGRWSQAILLSFGLLITMISVQAMKLLFHRPRPPVPATGLLVSMPSDWSFPSGHAAQATAFFLALSLVALRSLPPFWSRSVALASLAAVLAVCSSRIYLQVHYLSDVVAGMVLAVVAVSALQAGIIRLSWLRGK